MSRHSNAFGYADGSRGPLDKQHDFVTLPTRFGSVGRPIDEHLRARVVVGSQGTGKTLFLRRMQVHFLNDNSVQSVPPTLETSELDTDTVIQFCQMFTRSTNSEAWTRLWERAIWLAGARHLVEDSTGHGSANTRSIARLRDLSSQLAPAAGVSDPVEIVAMLCRSMDGKAAFDRIVNDSRWLELRRTLKSALADSRELYLFIDAIDDNYHYAPAYWQQCQRGLFYAVMHSLRTGTLDSKLHTVISIRDLVFSSVQRSEHGLRYENDEAIISLSWNWSASREFLDAKIQQLDAELFQNPSGPRNLHTFLGRQEVRNVARGTSEPVDTYLLRHTRLCPRDIIYLGNAITAMADQTDCLPAALSDEVLREVVASSSKRFTRYSLIQAGNQILTNIMPWNASSHHFTQSFLSDDEYTAESMEREVRSILITVPCELLSNEDLDDLESEAESRFGADCHFSDVMWQNGLLGYVDTAQRARYYGGAAEDRTSLPREGLYLLHPILLDSLPSIDLADINDYDPGSMGA